MRNWHCRRNGAKKKRKPRRRPGSSKFRYNYHHIYPKSRRKCGDLGKFEELFGSLRLWVQIKKQKAWHAVFSNLMPEEALFLIRKCFENGIDYANPVPEIIGAVKSRLYPPRNGNADITPADLAAWKEIFQDIRGFKKIKKEIAKKWMHRGAKAIIAGGKIIGAIIDAKKLPGNSSVRENMRRYDITPLPNKIGVFKIN